MNHLAAAKTLAKQAGREGPPKACSRHLQSVPRSVLEIKNLFSGTSRKPGPEELAKARRELPYWKQSVEDNPGWMALVTEPEMHNNSYLGRVGLGLGK